MYCALSKTPLEVLSDGGGSTIYVRSSECLRTEAEIGVQVEHDTVYISSLDFFNSVMPIFQKTYDDLVASDDVSDHAEGVALNELVQKILKLNFGKDEVWHKA